VKWPVKLLLTVANMSRTAVSRSFSLKPEEAPRFDGLVERLADGSPTEFVRQAMDRMEAVENWQLFEEIRSLGLIRAQHAGMSTSAQVRRAVRDVLNPTSKKRKR
jgi:hypothetical protein